MREITKKCNDKSSVVEEIKVGDQKLSDKGSIAESFNEFFSTIGESIADNIAPTNKTPDDYLTDDYPNNFAIEATTPDEVIEKTMKLKSKHSSDCTELSSVFVKKVIKHIAIPLSHIFNLSFSQGIFPQPSKIAKVVPVFKAGVRDSTNNYRPISLLPIFSKILEKLIADRLSDFLKRFSILYKHQYGFQRGFSTIHPIIHLLNYIAEAINKKQFTIAIFCDLTKAFDTVNHGILFKKLQYYGIRGVELQWFKSYLSERSQCVAIGEAKSTLRPITIGVPQGSVLGPILFLLYINDLPNASNMLPYLFADDTTCVASGPDLTQLISEVNVEFQKLSEWFRANKLSLHPGKTKFSIFCNEEKSIPIGDQKIYFNNNDINSPTLNITLIKPLEYVNKNSKEPAIKFLGLYLDQFLNFKFHIKKIAAKLSSALFFIRRSKYLLTDSALKTLYFSLFHCHLEYAILAWGSAKPGILQQIVKKQKNAIRLIAKAPYNAHTEPLFKKLGILRFEDLLTFSKLKFMHSFSNKKLPISFENTWVLNRDRGDRGATLRDANDLYVPKARINFSSRLPLQDFPKIWNNFEDHLKQIASPRLFISNLKLYFLNDLAENVSCGRPFCRSCFPENMDDTLQ